jgi:glycosyltransferase involved in cell wall biosynthesis
MPKVLFVSEFSKLKSGYAVYTNEILQRLCRVPGLEVAELACNYQDGMSHDQPWHIFPVVPRMGTREFDQFRQNPYWTFGAAAFDPTVLQFKPDVVIDIRDIWHFEYQHRSAFRPFFAHLIMPAIDAYPQHKSWIDLYAQADKVLSYTDWAVDILKENGLTNLGGVASPAASPAFREMSRQDKKNLQKSLGLGDNVRIIGTVMRNQGRKLFPELFRDFKRLLDETGDTNLYLLCHTSSPDTFLFDELLNAHGIGNRVLFTYTCRQEEPFHGCGNIEISFYRGEFSFCSKCGKGGCSTLPNTGSYITEQNLAVIYNLMDLYVQYASNEGFGMPMAEALACGVPIAAINYSAMAEVVHKAGGRKIAVKNFYREPETGRQYASPEPSSFIHEVKSFFAQSDEEQAREAALQKLSFGMRSWDETADVWLKNILTAKPAMSWNAPARNLATPHDVPQNCSNSDFARFLIANILHEPERLGTYFEARLVRDLNNGYCMRGMGDSFFVEDINHKQGHMMFNRQIALDRFMSILVDRQKWEHQRLIGMNR